MNKISESTSASSNPAEALAQTMRQIYELGLTTTSGGNLSMLDDEGRIWITPAGVDKGELREDQVARVGTGVPGGFGGIDENGQRDPDSAPRPSSELPFHGAIYAARSDLRAIFHAHPVSLVAFSIVRQVPDTRISAFSHALCADPGFASYALPGSDALGKEIAQTFAKGFDCVVLENHGVVVAGRTLREAFERLEALDLCARTILCARTLGGERLLSSEDLALGSEAARATVTLAPALGFSEGRGEEAERKEADERELRRTICEIVRRAHRRRLFTSTQGALSARLPGGGFLLTPRGIRLDQIESSDLVRLDPGRVPSAGSDPREVLHGAIYEAHPEVGAIAQGYGEKLAGFSTAGVSLPARTIPESYILVREPASVSFRETLCEPATVAAALGTDNPVALVDNDGALVLGANCLDAFDRMEVLESTAAALIASRPLGELAAMSDEQLVALRRAFFPTGGFQGAPHGGSS